MAARGEQSLGFSLFRVRLRAANLGYVPSSLIDHYLPHEGDGVLQAAAAHARGAAKARASAGTPIRDVRSLYVAEDELCFHVFEAPSREAVVEAVGRDGLARGRITETEERARRSHEPGADTLER